MRAKPSVLLAGIVFVLLAGCQKKADTTPAANDPTPGSSPAVSAAPPGGSVALPADKAPASDAAIAPSTPSAASSGGSGSEGKSGDANSQTQANPAELKKEQEQAAMPQTGQTNNHSAPDAAGTQGTPK